MHPGLTRDQALTPLTEIGPEKLTYDGAIADFEISADGEQVAFTTLRTQFPLGFPQYVRRAGARTGAAGAVRRRPARRHAHARDARLRGWAERTAAQNQPPGRRPVRVAPQGLRRALARLLRQRGNARVHLDGRQPRLRGRQHAPRRHPLRGTRQRQRRVPGQTGGVPLAAHVHSRSAPRRRWAPNRRGGWG